MFIGITKDKKMKVLAKNILGKVVEEVDMRAYGNDLRVSIHALETKMVETGKLGVYEFFIPAFPTPGMKSVGHHTIRNEDGRSN